MTPVGREGNLVWAGALVAEVEAEARALGRVSHKEGAAAGERTEEATELPAPARAKRSESPGEAVK